jgi:hypothetical protein
MVAMMAQSVLVDLLWLRLDVCIGRLGIAFSAISISCDIRIGVNTNIHVWMVTYLVPRIDTLVQCQIVFGWSK